MRFLLLCGALAACAPTSYIAPRLTRTAPSPAPLEAGDTWWTVLLHVHSVLNFVWLYDREAEIADAERSDMEARLRGQTAGMRNYNPDAIVEMLDRAARRGADALILTEHNTLVHTTDPRLPLRRGPTRLFRQATEWTSWGRGGHALVLGMRALVRPASSRTADLRDLAKLLPAARAQGATVIIAHPTTPNSPWRSTAFPEDAQAVEVINSWPFDSRGSEDLWHAALQRGTRLGAVAGADWHAALGPPIPADWRVNQVRAREITEEAIYRAIALGRTVAMNGHHNGLALRLRVADRCREGDVCTVKSDAPVPIDVEVRGGGGLELEIFDDASTSSADPAARLPVVGQSFRVRVLKRIAAGARGFVRATLRGVSTVAVGSPVYLLAQ
jgi:hypothetical protein